MPVREGLRRLDGVAFISKYPDLKTATCEVRFEGGRFIDPLSFSNHVFEIRVGARLRGLEAAIDGEIQPNGTNLLFKLSGTNAVLQLAPLTRKVQQNVAAKQPVAVTSKEAEAFRKLADKVKFKSRRAQIVGPLVRRPDGSLLLEVRSFKML